MKQNGTKLMFKNFRTSEIFVKVENLLFNSYLDLKEYSVILIKSFYDINQQILRKNGYFQNFSWFWFSVCKLCMIMYISTAQ